MAHAARIFVSHAHEDTAWCRAFVQALREAGADVWYDEHDLGDGVIGEEIARELQARPIFIVILSPAALASPLVHREVRAASDVWEKAGPSTRSMLLVMAEPADVPRVWADYPRVSGPGEGGLSAPEAARRALATLTSAPAHTPGAAAVSASSEPARKVTAYRPGPRAPNRDTGQLVASTVLVASAVLVAVTVGILARLVFQSTPTSSTFQNIPYIPDTVSSYPEGITTGPDGALWFADGAQIGQITTSGQVRDFPPPSAHSYPEGITAGPDGALWFTEHLNNEIGRITTSGQLREFPLPTASGAPSSAFTREITTGPDGALWFTDAVGNRVGRITTSGQVRVFPLPTPSSGPVGITTGPDGALWFTEYERGRIGRITTSGQLSEFPLPLAVGGSASSFPERTTGITTGPDGALWFAITGSEGGRNGIGRITTSGQVREFPLPTASSGPFGITVGPDGALWFTELDGNQMGRITTSGQVREFPIPTFRSAPSGITTGPDGALWFTEHDRNQIGRITTGGQLREFPLPTPTASSAPEGITAGSNGVLWLSESNGKQMGRIVGTEPGGRTPRPGRGYV